VVLQLGLKLILRRGFDGVDSVLLALCVRKAANFLGIRRATRNSAFKGCDAAARVMSRAVYLVRRIPKNFAAFRTHKAQEHTVYTVRILAEGSTSAQAHDTTSYLKPGDRIAVTKPHLFDVAEHKEIPVKDDLFLTPWSINQIRWAADSSRFTFLYNQRGHQVMRVIAVDASSGETKSIIDEVAKTFIDYTNKVFTRYLTETNEILWMSERDAGTTSTFTTLPRGR